jgi:hypothetical protein
MIPEEHKVDIITNGIQFMRSITEAYGTDDGLKLWGTIADTLDPDVKGQIFFAMITGEYQNKLRCSINRASYNRNRDKIAVIKEIRTWTGHGLKEAKDLADLMIDQNLDIAITVSPDKYKAARMGLTNVGLTVS